MKKSIAMLCVLTIMIQAFLGITAYAEAKPEETLREFNLSYKAKAVASVVEPNPAYSITTLNDGIASTSFTPSWSSDYQDFDSGNIWAGLDWSNNVDISRIKLYTVKGYELKQYKVQLLVDNKWETVVSEDNNTSAIAEYVLDKTYSTNKLRVICLRGPDVQDYIARLTEIETFNDDEVLKKAIETIDIGDIDAISDDMNLPNNLLDGLVNVEWNSADTDVIDNNGLVKQPAYGTQDKKVDLTAKLTFGNNTLDRTFSATVKETLPDEGVVKKIKDELILENTKNLVDDIILPLSDLKGYASISWKSSDTSVITNTGKIIRSNESTKSATLTATISRGNAIEYKDFEVTVLQQLEPIETITTEKWRVAEFELVSNAAYEYPYVDVDTEATFISQNGTVIKRKAFYDGGNVWRVRFAPTEEGEWTYLTSSTNREDTGLHGRTGKVICKAYTGDLDIYKHGFIQREEGKRYLTYADGTPFLYIADCGWMNLSSRAPLYETNMPTKGESVFKTIIDTRLEQGYNAYRMNFFIGLGRDVYMDGNHNEGGYPWTKGRMYNFLCSSSVGQDLVSMYASQERAFDGIETDYWRAETNAYPQWIQINWKEQKTVDKVRINFMREDVWNFDIEVSDDGTNYTKIYSTPKEGFNGKVFDYDIPQNIKTTFFKLIITGCKSEEAAGVCEMTPVSDDGEELTLSHYFRDLNADFFKNTDERIQYIVDNGMVANLGLDWGRHLMPGMDKEFKRFAEYVQARYGAYPVMWHTAGEAGTGHRESWIEIAKYMKEIDSYNHVNTIHNDISNPDYSLDTNDLDWHDVNYTQMGHDINYADVSQYWNGIYNREPVKPFIEGEAYFENINGLDSYITREGYWKAVMSGSAGFAYSAEGLWQTTYDHDDTWQVWGAAPIPWYIALYKEAGAQLPYMKEFLENLNWWELVPDENAVVWNNAPSGRQLPYQKRNLDSSVLVAYVPSNDYAYNGIAKLRPNSEFTAKWYNTKTGEYTLIDNKIKTTQSGTWLIPNTPDYTTDWALVITLNTINSAAFNEISFDRMSAEQPYNVNNNIQLINKTSDGSKIVWESSNNNVLNSKTGEVKQTETDEQITLIAKIITGKGTDYKRFYLTVKAKQPID